MPIDYPSMVGRGKFLHLLIPFRQVPYLISIDRINVCDLPSNYEKLKEEYKGKLLVYDARWLNWC